MATVQFEMISVHIDKQTHVHIQVHVKAATQLWLKKKPS